MHKSKNNPLLIPAVLALGLIFTGMIFMSIYGEEKFVEDVATFIFNVRN